MCACIGRPPIVLGAGLERWSYPHPVQKLALPPVPSTVPGSDVRIGHRSFARVLHRCAVLGTAMSVTVRVRVGSRERW